MLKKDKANAMKRRTAGSQPPSIVHDIRYFLSKKGTGSDNLLNI